MVTENNVRKNTLMKYFLIVGNVIEKWSLKIRAFDQVGSDCNFKILRTRFCPAFKSIIFAVDVSPTLMLLSPTALPRHVSLEFPKIMRLVGDNTNKGNEGTKTS
jgi:hypothetical protein